SGEDRLDLGPEEQCVIDSGIEERLDAQMIARQDHAMAIHVVKGKREHAIQLANEALSILPVCVNEHLGVAMGAKPVAEPEEPLGQLPVVVDFPVEGDPNRAVFIRQRLGTTLKVDDAQATVAEADAALAVDAHPVRAPVRYHVAHSDESFVINRRARPGVGDTTNAAHLATPQKLAVTCQAARTSV